MNHNIQSQIDRAKELNKELYESSKLDLQSHLISDKTKNLTQEILVKIKSTLDQTMRYFFEKKITPHLSEDDKRKAKVYFPLVSKSDDLKSVLGRAKMTDLDNSHPKVFSFLESVQPYNKNYSWLNDLSKYANERHIRLTPQIKNEENETIIGNFIGVSKKAKVKMINCSINGIPISSEDINRSPIESFDPRLNVKRTTWITFLFEDSEVNTLWLCNKSIKGTKKIINDFFSLF